MALHDAYARRTPYELFLPDEDFADEHFPQIADEIEERGRGAEDPERFVMLMRVGEALRELKGPEDDPQRIRQHGALLFHAFHFWRVERPLFLLTTDAARRAVREARRGEGAKVDRPGSLAERAGGAERPTLDGRPEDGPGLPAPAGYLQLPQHLFWSRSDPEATPESIDGLFWATHGGMVTVLAVVGVRPGRPGFTVFDLPRAPLDEWRLWIGQAMRDDEEDFAASIPGAELDELYETRVPGELLELLVLPFRDPGASTEEWPGPPPGAGEGDAPPPSVLPYVRILSRPDAT